MPDHINMYLFALSIFGDEGECQMASTAEPPNVSTGTPNSCLIGVDDSN